MLTKSLVFLSFLVQSLYRTSFRDKPHSDLRIILNFHLYCFISYTESWGPIPGDLVHETGYTLDRVPIRHRKHLFTH